MCCVSQINKNKVWPLLPVNILPRLHTVLQSRTLNAPTLCACGHALQGHFLTISHICVPDRLLESTVVSIKDLGAKGRRLGGFK